MVLCKLVGWEKSLVGSNLVLRCKLTVYTTGLPHTPDTQDNSD